MRHPVVAILLTSLGCAPAPAQTTLPAAEIGLFAYTWEPVTPAADRLVYACKVNLREYDVGEIHAAMNALPPGKRAIRIMEPPALTRHREDNCRLPDGTLTGFWYPEPKRGVEVVRDRMLALVRDMKQAGVPLDEVINDYEAGYQIQGRGFEDHKAHLAAIQADPRFKGVHSLDADDLENLNRVLNFNFEDSLVWDAVSRRIVDRALQEAIYEPLRRYYPDARCSNFHSHRLRRSLAIPDHNGRRRWWESDGFGTHESMSAFGALRKKAAELPLRDGRPLGSGAYSALLHTIKLTEAVDHSSPRPLKVWFSPRDMPLPQNSPFTGTPYHDELVRHLCVRRYGLILFNGTVGHDDAMMLQTNSILSECAEHIGEHGTGRRHTTDWADEVIQSRTNNGDRIVARFTLEHPERGVRYSINGEQKQVFPKEGEVGVWISWEREDVFDLVK